MPGAGMPNSLFESSERVFPEGTLSQWRALSVALFPAEDSGIRLAPLLWASLGLRKGVDFEDVTVAMHQLRTFDKRRALARPRVPSARESTFFSHALVSLSGNAERS